MLGDHIPPPVASLLLGKEHHAWALAPCPLPLCQAGGGGRPECVYVSMCNMCVMCAMGRRRRPREGAKHPGWGNRLKRLGRLEADSL